MGSSGSSGSSAKEAGDGKEAQESPMWAAWFERHWGVHWPTILGTLVTLAGIVLTVGVSLVVLVLQLRNAAELQAEATRSASKLQAEALGQDRDLETRTLRRDLYLEYLQKTNEWVLAQRDRAITCKPGTNKRKIPEVPCSPSYLGELQTIRFDLRGLENRMSTVESLEMSALRAAFLETFPSADARDAGPIERAPDRENYSFLYRLALDVTTCDTNPTPDADTCEDVYQTARLEAYRRITEEN